MLFIPNLLSFLFLVPIISSEVIEIEQSKKLLIQRRQIDLNVKKYLQVQEILSSNTIRAFDVEYSLDGLTPSKIYSATARYLFNDRYADLPLSIVLEKNHEEEHIITVYDGHNQIRSVVIHDKVRRRTVELKSIGDNQLATVSSKKYPSESFPTSLKKLFDFAMRLLNYAEEVDEIMNGRMQHHCLEFKVIDLAVVYDSSFCSKLNGKENAEAEIASIVSMVSNKFKQDGLCVKVQICYLEGYCDVALDPYRKMIREGVQSSVLLEDFSSYWINNRNDVDRTVAHLFTGTAMADNVVGRGYTGTICSTKTAYAVQEVTWHTELTMRVAIVTHELAHNVGANHIDNDSTIKKGCSNSNDFLMQSKVTEGKSGFHETSIEQMRNVIDSRSCMKTITV